MLVKRFHYAESHVNTFFGSCQSLYEINASQRKHYGTHVNTLY